MSEWDAHVYCTCFLKGLTSDPPYPRSELTVNRFGVVTLNGSEDHSKDPEDLWGWRVGWGMDGCEVPSPCEHDDMMLIDEIFYFPGSYWHELPYPCVENRVGGADFSLLQELFARGAPTDFPSGGIWAVAAEALGLLGEAQQLIRLLQRDCPHFCYGMTKTLIRLLGASEQTGNPIITHYNGTIDGAW